MTKSVTTMIGGLVASFFASVCCIGPVIFAALGVGVGATGSLAGMAGFMKTLLPYRPIFISLTMILFAIGFYSAYRKPPSAVCAPGAVCTPGAMSREHRALLWVLAALALVVILAPYWLGL